MSSPEPNPRPAAPAVPVWVSFVSLALVWGSSFLFIKIGLDQGLPPFVLVSYRLASAALFLLVVIRLTHGSLPRTRDAWSRLIVLGVVNVAVPFSLLTWGEQYTSSAIAAIGNGLVPLFAIVLASLVLHDEPITLNRLAGLVIGFVGAVLLASPSLGKGSGGGSQELVGELAIALASLSYACGAVYARHAITGRPIIDDPVRGPRPPTPVEIALPQVVVAGTVTTVLAIITEIGQADRVIAPPSLPAWFAVLWLGLLGSGVAYLLLFRIIRAWGATRATLVTYIMPIVGIALGIAILGERLDPAEIAGTVLIIGGLLLANSKYGQRRLYGRASAPTAPTAPTR
jgi:drug/metabolite transporter (DMT)-like permease